MNLTLYAKWINQKLQFWCRVLLKTLNDAKEEREVTNDVDLRVSLDYMVHKLIVLEEVLWYMDFIDNFVLDLEAQKGFAKDVHDDV